MDELKEKALLSWVRSLTDGEMYSSLRNMDFGTCFINILQYIDNTATLEELPNSKDRVLAAKRFLEDFYNISFIDEKLINFSILLESVPQTSFEEEIAKVLLLLLCAGIQVKNSDILGAAMRLDASLHWDVRMLIEAVVRPDEPTMSLSPDFAKVFIQRSVSDSRDSPLRVGVASLNLCSLNDSLQTFSPLRLAASPATPLEELVNSPQLAHKIMRREKEHRHKLERQLKEKEESLKSCKQALRSEVLLREDLELDLQEANAALEKKDYKITELEQKVGQARTLQDRLDDLGALHDSNLELERDIENLRERAQRAEVLRECYQTLRDENKGLYEELSSLQEKLSNMEAVQSESSKSHIVSQKLKIKVSELEAQIDVVREAHDKMSQEKSSVEADVELLKSLNHRLRQQLMERSGSMCDIGLDGENMGVVSDKIIEDLRSEMEELRRTWVKPGIHSSLVQELEELRRTWVMPDTHSSVVQELEELRRTWVMPDIHSSVVQELEELRRTWVKPGIHSSLVQELEELHRTWVKPGIHSSVVQELEELHRTWVMPDTHSSVVQELEELRRNWVMPDIHSSVVQELEELRRTWVMPDIHSSVVQELEELHRTWVMPDTHSSLVQELEELRRTWVMPDTHSTLVQELEELRRTWVMQDTHSTLVQELEELHRTWVKPGIHSSVVQELEELRRTWVMPDIHSSVVKELEELHRTWVMPDTHSSLVQELEELRRTWVMPDTHSSLVQELEELRRTWVMPDVHSTLVQELEELRRTWVMPDVHSSLVQELEELRMRKSKEASLPESEEEVTRLKAQTESKKATITKLEEEIKRLRSEAESREISLAKIQKESSLQLQALQEQMKSQRIEAEIKEAFIDKSNEELYLKLKEAQEEISKLQSVAVQKELSSASLLNEIEQNLKNTQKKVDDLNLLKIEGEKMEALLTASKEDLSLKLNSAEDEIRRLHIAAKQRNDSADECKNKLTERLFATQEVQSVILKAEEREKYLTKQEEDLLHMLQLAEENVSQLKVEKGERDESAMKCQEDIKQKYCMLEFDFKKLLSEKEKMAEKEKEFIKNYHCAQTEINRLKVEATQKEKEVEKQMCELKETLCRQQDENSGLVFKSEQREMDTTKREKELLQKNMCLREEVNRLKSEAAKELCLMKCKEESEDDLTQRFALPQEEIGHLIFEARQRESYINSHDEELSQMLKKVQEDADKTKVEIETDCLHKISALEEGIDKREKDLCSVLKKLTRGIENRSVDMASIQQAMSDKFQSESPSSSCLLHLSQSLEKLIGNLKDTQTAVGNREQECLLGIKESENQTAAKYEVLREKFQETLQENKDRIQSLSSEVQALSWLKQEAEQRAEETEEYWKLQLKNLQEEVESDMKQQRMTFERDLEDQKDEYETRLKSVSDEHEGQLLGQKAIFENKLIALQEALNSRQAKFSKLMSQKEAEHKQKLEVQEAETEHKLANLEQCLSMIKEAESSHCAQMTEDRARIQELERNMRERGEEFDEMLRTKLVEKERLLQMAAQDSEERACVLQHVLEQERAESHTRTTDLHTQTEQIKEHLSLSVQRTENLEHQLLELKQQNADTVRSLEKEVEKQIDIVRQSDKEKCNLKVKIMELEGLVNLRKSELEGVRVSLEQQMAQRGRSESDLVQLQMEMQMQRQNHNSQIQQLSAQLADCRNMETKYKQLQKSTAETTQNLAEQLKRYERKCKQSEVQRLALEDRLRVYMQSEAQWKKDAEKVKELTEQIADLEAKSEARNVTRIPAGSQSNMSESPEIFGMPVRSYNLHLQHQFDGSFNNTLPQTPGAAERQMLAAFDADAASLDSCSDRQSVYSAVSVKSSTYMPTGSGKMFSCAEEPEPRDGFECLAGRLNELQRRNTLCLPHMKSSYPVETQAFKDQVLDDNAIQQTKYSNTTERSAKSSLSSRKRKPETVDVDEGPLVNATQLEAQNRKLARHGPAYQKPGPPTPVSDHPRKSACKRSGDDRQSGTPRHMPRRSPRHGCTQGPSTVERLTQDPRRESIAFEVGFSPVKTSGLRRLTRQLRKLPLNTQQPTLVPGNMPQPSVTHTPADSRIKRLGQTSGSKVARKPLGIRNCLQTPL